MLAERLKIPEIIDGSKIKICLDVDGVIACPTVTVVRIFNEIFETNYKISDVVDWNSTLNWAKALGMTDEGANKLHRYLWFDTPSIHKQYPTIPGAVSLLRRLSESPLVDLNIRSSRLKTIQEVTFSYFDEVMPFIGRERIVVTNKVDEIIRINPDICVEDSPKDAEKILESTKAYVVMVPYAYNYGKFKHERLIEYDSEEVNLNSMPTLWPVYQLFKNVGIFGRTMSLTH